MARRACDGPECGEETAAERPKTLVFGRALTFGAGERVDRAKLAARQAVSNTPDLTEGTEGPAQIPWLTWTLSDAWLPVDGDGGVVGLPAEPGAFLSGELDGDGDLLGVGWFLLRRRRSRAPPT